MPADLRALRRWISLAIWAAGLLLFAALAWWNINDSRRDAENRLISEAGRTAAQVASLLSIPGWALDDAAAMAAVEGAMEDERIYAVRVENDEGMAHGLRRNYQWEPVAWDGDLAENCVQGMTPLRFGPQMVGKVFVWLSPRLNAEEDALLVQREKWRFACFMVLWTGALLLCFWQWGDFRRLKKVLTDRKNTDRSQSESVVLGLSQKPDNARIEDDAPGTVIDANLGRKYQRLHPDAWLVTAGMFRQTFVRGPELINRLYAEGEMAGLCHLGRILEQAAPCIGAGKLAEAAREMQAAINNPECHVRATPVENCARCLDEVLDALCGDGQWRSRKCAPRS